MGEFRKQEDDEVNQKKKQEIKNKHTTAGIRMWSPTILLTCRRVA
jgi:hypothetical protein